jgi:hypothetical protein
VVLTLSFCSFTQAALELLVGGDDSACFSVLCDIGRSFMGWGLRMSQSLILIYAMSFYLLGEKRKRKNKKKKWWLG